MDISLYDITKPSYLTLFPIIILQSLPMSFLEPIMPIIEVSFFSDYENECLNYSTWNDICKNAANKAVYTGSVTSCIFHNNFILIFYFSGICSIRIYSIAYYW